jgi:hypothetical protein
MSAAAVLLFLAAAAEPIEIWAGHAVVVGKRSVPILGKVEAATESWVIARVSRTKDGIHIEQKSCRVELSNPLGVDLFLNPGAAEKLPAIILDFKRRPDGMYYQDPNISGWAEEDVDGDGKKGLTVNVDAPICGGKLFVGLKTKSMSRGTISAGGEMRGEMKAKIGQKVYGTEGACISLLADDVEEAANGAFAYVRTSSTASCASLSVLPKWPILAPKK